MPKRTKTKQETKTYKQRSNLLLKCIKLLFKMAAKWSIFFVTLHFRKSEYSILVIIHTVPIVGGGGEVCPRIVRLCCPCYIRYELLSDYLNFNNRPTWQIERIRSRFCNCSVLIDNTFVVFLTTWRRSWWRMYLFYMWNLPMHARVRIVVRLMLPYICTLIGMGKMVSLIYSPHCPMNDICRFL